MFRAHVLATAAVVAQILALAPATALERVQIDPTQVLVYVEPRDVENTHSDGPDGSSLIGGHLGAQPGCAGVQAFVKKLDAGGAVVWELSASADKDCDLDGQPDGIGEPMFENMTSLDPDFILSSTVHEAIFAADGSVYFTGQLLVAWEVGGVLTVAWGAFVIQEQADGGHLADVYVGPQPGGSPVQLSDCIAVCMALGESSLTQWGGRALAEATDAASPFPGMVLVGWKWSSASQGANDKDVFLAVLHPGLQTARWYTEFPFPGADLPLDVVVATGGDVYATGYYGSDRDVFVARIDGEDGTLIDLFVGGGPLDDWGEVVEVNAAGEIEIEGTFTDTATFAGEVLVGDGPTGFRAVLTPTLELILIEVLGGGPSLRADPLKDAANQQTLPPSPPSQPSGTTSNTPTSVEVLVGSAGSGTNPFLVSTSDNEYLVLHGQPEPDHSKVEVVFEVPIEPGASILKEVKLEIRSNYCTRLDVFLGGGGAEDDMFYAIGEDIPICAFDEPTIGFGIPTYIAEEKLGFSATSQPAAPLELLMDTEIYGTPPPVCEDICASSPDDDEALDELAIHSEYP